MSVAQAAADPTRRFVLSTGDPLACLESRGDGRPRGDVALDGPAVLAPCGTVAGQAWSLRATPDGTYRLSNRTRQPDLCFEGGPRTAPDGAASTPCGRSPGQVWRVVTTSAGFQRLGTDGPGGTGPRCLGALPAPGGVPEVAMVPCEPLERAPGALRSTQDWELTPAPPVPEPPRSVAPPKPKPTSTPTAKPKPKPARPGGTAVDDMLAEVNAARADAGCGPVRRDARLDRAAEGHASWMNGGGAFSHTGKGGSSPTERIESQGWNGSTGENIAEGQTSASEVMTDWMNSPGHRRNILDCEFTSIGLAREGSAGDQKWVQTFGGG